MCGSVRAATHWSTPSAWRAGGRIVARVVEAAVYGYWSAATSRPSARAASRRADRLAGTSPDGFRPALEVGDLEPGARPAGTDRRDRLVERREQLVGLVAHVGRVQAAAPGGRRDQGLDLAGGGVHPGGIDEPRWTGRSPRRRARPRPRGPSPPARRRSAARASAPMTDPRTVPWPTRNATFGPSGCSATRSRYSPNVRQRATRPFGRSSRVDGLAADVGDRRQRVAAVPRQLRRVALVQEAGQRPVEEERAVGVAVRIDETRRDDAAGDVEDRLDLALARPSRGRRQRGSGRRGRRHRPGGRRSRSRR